MPEVDCTVGGWPAQTCKPVAQHRVSLSCAQRGVQLPAKWTELQLGHRGKWTAAVIVQLRLDQSISAARLRPQRAQCNGAELGIDAGVWPAGAGIQLHRPASLQAHVVNRHLQLAARMPPGRYQCLAKLVQVRPNAYAVRFQLTIGQLPRAPGHHDCRPLKLHIHV